MRESKRIEFDGKTRGIKKKLDQTNCVQYAVVRTRQEDTSPSACLEACPCRKAGKKTLSPKKKKKKKKKKEATITTNTLCKFQPPNP